MADAKARRKAKKAPACADCQGKDTVPIVYGFPSPETCEAAEQGKVAIGGCVIEPHNPRWACPTCDHRW